MLSSSQSRHKASKRSRDFRRLDLGQSGEWSPDLHAEYRRAHDQRDALLEIASLDAQPPSRAWRISVPDDNARIATMARDLLTEQALLPYPRPAADKYAHLGYSAHAPKQPVPKVQQREARIRDVCEELGIPWMTLPDFVDAQGWTINLRA